MVSSGTARARRVLARAKRVVTRERERRTLLVLSHMRSYSSLLCHILNSNPEIDGYVELHRRYRSAADLVELRAHVASLPDVRLEGRYVLDKLLHNKADVSRRVLRRNDVFTIFSIREPAETIRSTIQMVQRKKNPDEDWKNDPSMVARYYIRRVDRLLELGRREPAHAVFFDAQRLIDDTADLLKQLTTFLELREPLRERYETFELTGRAKFGDPGRFIGSGEIVREREVYPVEIPPDDLARATEAFERARAEFATLMPVLGAERYDTKPSPGPR